MKEEVMEESNVFISLIRGGSFGVVKKTTQPATLAWNKFLTPDNFKDSIKNSHIMKAHVEDYKGIKFIRISLLPDDQKKTIQNSIGRDKIITILKSDCQMRDCVQAKDYERWYAENYMVERAQAEAQPAEKQPDYQLAFK
jgi:hypothetical protein